MKNIRIIEKVRLKRVSSVFLFVFGAIAFLRYHPFATMDPLTSSFKQHDEVEVL